MPLKRKWKKFGKSTGKAFANFGRAVKSTIDVIDDKELNVYDEKHEQDMKNYWKNLGRNFGDAGKNFGKAMGGTASYVFTGKDDIPDEEDNNTKENQDNNKAEVLLIEDKDEDKKD